MIRGVRGQGSGQVRSGQVREEEEEEKGRRGGGGGGGEGRGRGGKEGGGRDEEKEEKRRRRRRRRRSFVGWRQVGKAEEGKRSGQVRSGAEKKAGGGREVSSYKGLGDRKLRGEVKG